MSLTCITYQPEDSTDLSILGEYAATRGIECWSCISRKKSKEDFLDLEERLREKKTAEERVVGIVCSFGYIIIIYLFRYMIPDGVIEAMGEYFYVIHPSLFPKYRGAAPI